MHFLLGPSGCGKTTSLRMLAGLEQVSDGAILFDGKDVTKQPAAQRGVGMVFQNYALWPHMSVRKNVEYGLKLKKLSEKEISERINEVLSFTQLEKYVDRLPGQLSGGQQQRVALARALAIQPNVLLLDEPLSNLDAKLRMEMRDNILRIHKQTGITTVYVTHDQKEALSMGTEVSVMRAGHLMQSDSPRRLYNYPKSAFIAGFIGETNFVEAKLIDKQGDELLLETKSLGKLRAKASSYKPEMGSEVLLSMRPEAIHIDWNGSLSLDNSFELSVEHLTYLGESEQFLLRSDDNKAMKINFYHAPEHNFVEGSRIKCGVKMEDILVLPADYDVESGT